MLPRVSKPLLATSAAILTLVAAEGAQAEGNVLAQTEGKVREIYNTVWSVTMVIGGVGLIVMAIMAFFGKFKFTHLLALAGGLFLLGMTNPLIDYLVGTEATAPSIPGRVYTP